MTSQTDRTVRSLPDSHPNRPTRPDPSRPITTNRRSIHNLRLGDESTKTCIHCERVLRLDAFYAMSSSRDGRQPYCIECKKAYNRANAERIRARHRDYLIRTGRQSSSEVRPQQAPRTPLQILVAGQVADPSILRGYGLTEGDYECMQVAQGYRCAICFEPPPSGRRLSVDHCHTTNVVRGLLCSPCNLAIGLLRDDAQRALGAAAYLNATAARLMDGGYAETGGR